jgi:hypothetical protein
MASIGVACSLVFTALATSAVAQVADAAILTGVWRDGRLPVAALELGDGGIAAAPSPSDEDQRGRITTPGGVIVRAQREGVKLDFPSGAELLIAPDGAVHLRSGEHTATALHAVELWLADGARVRAVRGPQRGAPFREVCVVDGEHGTAIWQEAFAVRYPVRAPRPTGDCFFVLGAGDVLYRGTVLGPLLGLERVLCPARKSTAAPAAFIAVVGDVLTASLERLPARMPAVSIEFPEAPQVAANLAQGAPLLFPAGRLARPAGVAGELVFPLAHGFRLVVEERPGADLWLCLCGAGTDIPVVEWEIGARTTMHLVRPDGGASGGPRWFLRGIDVTDATRAAPPLPNALPAAAQMKRIVRSLGARPALRADVQRAEDA